MSSVTSSQPISLSPNISSTEDHSSSSNFLSVNHMDRTVRQDDYQPRRRLSSTSSTIKAKSLHALLSSSTSSLAGDMVLKPDDVIRLKENLRKTGLVEKNQTLRRKLPTETIQIDFRSVLHPTKNNRISTINK